MSCVQYQADDGRHGIADLGYLGKERSEQAYAPG